ncbi:hypothetical protein J4474_01245 [Candidatus Pacearchaeota archaeon]|nr:hypothetical protein [Candidatus Pacearchaeota archaeon]
MEKRKNKLIVILLILSLMIFLTGFYIKSIVLLEKMEIPTTLTVGDKIGFDTDTSVLTFGIIKPGSVGNREIFLENNYTFPIKVEFRVEGDIKRFLLFENIVYLNSGENKTISISTIKPTENDYGNYSGKLIVAIKKDN